MKGLTDVYGAFCKNKVAKYFKSYRHTMNSVEKANPSAEKDMADWLEDQEFIMEDYDNYEDCDGYPFWLNEDFGYKYF